jgi:hypothetical protein
VKSIFASKTFWLNLVAIAILILSSPAVLNVVPAQYLPYETAILGVLNIINRFFTKDEVTLFGPSGPTRVE